MKHATIKELSAACGLSVSTVSKALNGYSDISDETRRLVVDTAARIGYYPNATARALKTNRSYNLGVLFADENQSGLTHPFFASVLNSFKQEAEEKGYDITFISHNLAGNAMSFLNHCRYRNVDGVCLACVDFNAPEILELVDSGIPCVTIDHLFNKCPSVLSDNVSGMRTLTDCILSLGHTRITYIHGQRTSSVTEKRITGFYRSLDAHSVPQDRCLLAEGLYANPEETYRITTALLNKKDPPTCILLPDDQAYLGAREAAMDLGLRIGRDISFAGFDGLPLTQLLRPSLTTILQNNDAIGREAARRLIECVERPNTAGTEASIIPCTLIRGETVRDLTAES